MKLYKVKAYIKAFVQSHIFMDMWKWDCLNKQSELNCGHAMTEHDLAVEHKDFVEWLMTDDFSNFMESISDT